MSAPNPDRDLPLLPQVLVAVGRLLACVLAVLGLATDDPEELLFAIFLMLLTEVVERNAVAEQRAKRWRRGSRA